MANWCTNIVLFNGDSNKLEEIEQLFNEMALREKETREGQLPPFVESAEGYCKDIYTEARTIHYETKWVPNTDILVQIADFYQVHFTHEYFELGFDFFGEATYEYGVLKDVRLEKEDLDLIETDEHGMHTFMGETYEIEEELLEYLLERKKDELNNSKGYRRHLCFRQKRDNSIQSHPIQPFNLFNHGKPLQQFDKI
ncbi:MAG: hypothetical protein KUL85_16925 [Sphingobacterium mizutaii]|nr:hypothetical protein [Sphingobacterium mizutaii]